MSDYVLPRISQAEIWSRGFFTRLLGFDAPRAARTAFPVSGVRAPPVAMPGTVGVRRKPAQNYWMNEPLSWEKLEITHSYQCTCVLNGTFSCVTWSENRSGSVGAAWSGWKNASLGPLRREERPQRQNGQSRRCCDAQTRRSTPYPALWQRRWWTGLPSPSSSRSPAPWQQLAASSREVWRWRCWSDWSWNTHSTLLRASRSSGGGSIAPVQHGLQGPVSKHDSVEGQRPGNGVLLGKLHEGEARRLCLVSGHSDELHTPHLPEEVEQLLCGGGLQTGVGRAFSQLSFNTGPLLTPADPTSSYLRVQVADVDGSPDLIDLCRVHVAHEGRLRGRRRCDFQTGWHPVHDWKVELREEQHHQRSLAWAARHEKKKKTHILEWTWSRNGQQPPTGYQTGHWRGRCQEWQGLGFLWDFPCRTEGQIQRRK